MAILECWLYLIAVGTAIAMARVLVRLQIARPGTVAPTVHALTGHVGARCQPSRESWKFSDDKARPQSLRVEG